jgi:hypothetical protein
MALNILSNTDVHGPWPKNLFGEPASLHELLSGAAQPAGG